MDYIHAYNIGIETYNDYYPVIQKISYYKRLPGVGMSGKSVTTGKVTQFSNNIGKWNTPGVTLYGFGEAAHIEVLVEIGGVVAGELLGEALDDALAVHTGNLDACGVGDGAVFFFFGE